MPNRQANLDTLMAEGMSVYPVGMGSLRAVAPRRFLSTSQSTIAGLGQRGAPGGTYGAAPRAPSWVAGRRGAELVVLNARQTAWGTGRSSRPPTKAERARNRQRFVQMLKKEHPRLYAIAKQRIGDPPAGMGGLGQQKIVATDDGGSWFDRFTDTISNLAPSYLQYKSQKELLDIQLQRAQAGLPPLETSQYAPAVQVGLDPEQTRAAIAAAGTRAGEFLTQPMVLAAGAGLLLLVMMRPGRRRA